MTGVARSLSGIAMFVCGALAAFSAVAQPYPARPVKVIVPFAAGGPADVYARIIGDKWAKVVKISGPRVE